MTRPLHYPALSPMPRSAASMMISRAAPPTRQEPGHPAARLRCNPSRSTGKQGTWFLCSARCTAARLQLRQCAAAGAVCLKCRPPAKLLAELAPQPPRFGTHLIASLWRLTQQAPTHCLPLPQVCDCPIPTGRSRLGTAALHAASLQPSRQLGCAAGRSGAPVCQQHAVCESLRAWLGNRDAAAAALLGLQLFRIGPATAKLISPSAAGTAPRSAGLCIERAAGRLHHGPPSCGCVQAR